MNLPSITDPAIQLGVVGRSLPFTVAPGDTRLPPVNFRTGTTAGGSGASVSTASPPAGSSSSRLRRGW